MRREGTKLAVGLVLMVIGAGALGYAIGADGAPDEADAATARASAQTKAAENARDDAYAAALVQGKADGAAQGTSAGRADGAGDGSSDGDAAVAAEQRSRDNASSDCLLPGLCFPPLDQGDSSGDFNFDN
jgi:hypothetical protein